MKAFIFDFDGVIVDSEIYWDRHTLSVYREMIPSFNREDDKKLKGRSIHDIYPMLVQDYGMALSKEEYMEHIRALTDKIYGEECALLPGLKELVARLHAGNVPTGIASSSQRDWIASTLKRLEYEDMFTPVVTAADVGVGKPNPAVYLEAARQMQAVPAECIAIEDSFNGVKAAKDAGMICIGVHHEEGYPQDLSQADIEINSLTEIDDKMLERLGLKV